MVRGDRLQILDPYDGSVRSEIIVPKDGVVFFAQEALLVYVNAAIYKIENGGFIDVLMKMRSCLPLLKIKDSIFVTLYAIAVC